MNRSGVIYPTRDVIVRRRKRGGEVTDSFCECVRAPEVTWDDDVHAGAGLADVAGCLVVHLPQGVGERPRGVDDTLGFDVKFLSCEFKQVQTSSLPHRSNSLILR